MAKTTKVIVFATMMVLGAALVFAQQSNADQATFGEIGTDVDNFLHSVNWKSVELNGLFAFTRIGANIQEGRTEVGVAFKPGSLYLGFYYNGDIMGYGEKSTSTDITLTNPSKTDDTKIIKQRNHQKANPHATYGALVGLANGMGIKLKFVDDLRVRPITGGDDWRGTLTPSLEIGGSFGPISRIGLSFPIVYNRTETVTTTNATGTPSAVGIYTTTALKDDGTPVTGIDELLKSKGNYVGPDLYLKMGFGTLTLENNLRMRFYGVPGYNKDGEVAGLAGNGLVTASYNFAEGKYSSMASVWDSRFGIEDTIKPSINVSGDAGKLTYSVTVGLPITFGGNGHALNYKYDAPDGGDSVEFKDYYKMSDFQLRIGPSVAAGVKYQLMDILAVQCGLSADIFTFGLDTTTGTKTEEKFEKAPTAYSAFRSVSDDVTTAETSWIYPKVTVAAGTTLTLAQKIGLDLLFFSEVIPSATGMIYKSASEAAGSSGISLVLTAKF